MARCSEVRGNGFECINKAKPGMSVCHVHDPANWCGQEKARGGKCRRPKELGQDTCSKHGKDGI